MFQKIKNRISLISACSLILIILSCQYLNIKEKENPYPISWDVYGYYLYLPATIIYHDLGLQKADWLNSTREKYKPSPAVYQIAKGEEDKMVINYNIGYSFIYAPGFIIANWLAVPLGFEQDGFSIPYQWSLLITAFLFTLIGILMFRKTSLLYFSDKITALLIVIVLLGSNYFYQVTYDGVQPHNFLFTLNCFIIWLTIKWHEDRRIRHMVLLGLVLGLATICRPTELIWILVPLLWNVNSVHSFKEKISTLLKQYFVQIICLVLLLILIISVQLFYWKYATGHFSVNLFEMTFSFLEPYTFKFLFSYRKGWLLYTPIMIFGIIGFYHLLKSNKKIGIALFFCLHAI